MVTTPFERATFFARVRSDFGPLTQGQVDGFNAILTEWEQAENGDLRHLAYMLATPWHETDRTMQPIREYGRGKGKDYGTVFYGRGLVQVTWRANYVKAGTRIGADLVSNPDLALDPVIAARIMFRGMAEGWFTGKKLSDYFNAATDDPVGARRIINGTDKAATIAGYHAKFLAALKAATVGTTAPQVAPKPLVVGTTGPRAPLPRQPDDPGPVVPPPAPRAGWLSALLSLFSRKA